MLIVQCDFERSDAVVFPPNIFATILIISRPDQNAVERQLAFNIERDAFADAIVLGAFGPGSLQLALRIGFDVDRVVVALPLRGQRRACRRIIIFVIEKVLVVPNDVGGTAIKILLRITSRIGIVF